MNIIETYDLLELAAEISAVSLGSNQTFFFPQRRTEAANRFCNFSELLLKGRAEININ